MGNFYVSANFVLQANLKQTEFEVLYDYTSFPEIIVFLYLYGLVQPGLPHYSIASYNKDCGFRAMAPCGWLTLRRNVKPEEDRSNMILHNVVYHIQDYMTS
jgi:hypothetical protein